MDPLIGTLVGGLSGLAVGAGVGFAIRHLLGRAGLAAAETRAKAVEDESARKAEAKVREAEDAAREAGRKRKEEAEREVASVRDAVRESERKLGQREDALGRQVDGLARKEKFLRTAEKSLVEKHQKTLERRQEVEKLVAERVAALERVSGMPREEARKQLLEAAEKEISHEEAILIQRQLERVREGVTEKARRLIANNIQRIASDYTTEITTASVDLPAEDIKGRIIGREGRNIRHFEKVTGCDVIVDDTPGTILVSSFEGVRREIARRSMAKLIADGRIHPARIEEVVAATQKEMDQHIVETGRKTCLENGLQNVHPEVVQCLGRLQFRTSFGQNVLLHSIEVGHIASMIAADLGLDPVLAKRCGLLHDIGKAVDQTQQGTHPGLGAEIAKRCGERPEVVEAIGGHHDDVNVVQYAYTVLANAADAISASRPGARRDSTERYIQRLQKLEEIGNAVEGVQSAYAIAAGREIRVILNPDKLNDDQALVVARDLAKRIEAELTYPGEIKVTVLREKRVVEYAR